ncbi:MAG TPA: EpsG family protein [Bacilli bacterium]|nr:EpsG family protein [Bacilli bacterium]
MGLLSIGLFLICPLIAVIVAAIGLIIGKEKHHKIYFLIIAFALAIIAYYFNPSSSDDLFRHHNDVITISNMSQTRIFGYLIGSSEQLSFILKYLVGLTGNVDLLQFIITFISYIIMFYLIDDSSKKYNVSKITFIFITIFTAISFNYLTICSNLFNTLGLLVFSLGLYLEYNKENKKVLAYILYVISALIHFSLLFAIFILLLFKLLGEKTNIKAIYLLLVIFLFIGPIIEFMYRNIDLGIVKEIQTFYNNYFINQNEFEYLHTTNVLVVYLSKLLPYTIIYLFFKQEKTKLSDFAFLMTIAIVGLFPSSTFSIRFIPIVQLTGLPMLFSYFKNNGREFKILLITLITILIGVYTYYQYTQLHTRMSFDYSSLMFKNIVSIFNKSIKA